MSTLLNRRRFQRFTVKPMYTPISVRTAAAADADSESDVAEGHAYDISEGGVRFELDRVIPPGTPITMQITLPVEEENLGPGPTIVAFATIAWIEDEDDPPPIKTAAQFTGFARIGDRERLLRAFSTGRYRVVG